MDATLSRTQFTVAATPPIVTDSDCGKVALLAGPTKSKWTADETDTTKEGGAGDDAASAPIRETASNAESQRGSERWRHERAPSVIFAVEASFEHESAGKDHVLETPAPATHVKEPLTTALSAKIELIKTCAVGMATAPTVIDVENP